MIRRNPTERGSALVEFVLCFALFWTPLFLGLLVMGLNLIRAIQVTQVCRTAGHMSAFGIDFSQPASQSMLVSLAPGLNMTTTGGNGVVVLSTITFADQTACDAAKLYGNCPNIGKAVITRRVVIGSRQLHTSAFGTPDANLVDGNGNITSANYLKSTTTVATDFLNVVPLKSSSQLAYLAEIWVTSPDFNIWSALNNTGSSARAIF